MTKKDWERAVSIPKRHTLRHYMKLVCELYGETKENTEEYIEERLKANEDNLDGAIECFKSLLPKNYEVERAAKLKQAELDKRWSGWKDDIQKKRSGDK